LGTKSNCWSYEKEVRIIFPKFPFKEDEECQLIDINKRSIKKIFLGSRISLENEKKVISTLLKTELSIEFYKMERKKNSFQLLPSKIDVKSSVANNI
jgi:hypothetical protein